MKIALSGGTGFIGNALSVHLANKGYTVYVLTRSDNCISTHPNIHYINWNATDMTFPLPSIDAFINLAGEPINSGRWTAAKKQEIIISRVATTQGILRQLAGLTERPKTFINASAIGYYGTSSTATFTEQDIEPGHDFLAKTVVQWEEAASKAESLGIRTIFARFGIVLGKGGALPKMALPYQFLIGGTVGSGQQWASWVHIDDAVNLITFALENELVHGPLNITSPHPITMEEFGRCIAKVLRKPHLIPVPSFMLKLILGEMSLLILEGQKVLPEKAMRNGYIYSHANLEEALTTILL